MKTLIVANWKCNPTTLGKAKRLFNSIGKGIRKIKSADVVICPPFLYLLNLKSSNLNLKLGAQNVFWKERGSYTGEISPLMLKDIGCEYVIIGHSERRKYFKETDKTINKKLKALLKAGLNPILCIGETREEREQGKTADVLKRQLSLALRSVRTGNKLQLTTFIIAYEPVWAIGSGNPCNIEEIKKVNLLIRKIISSLYSSEVAGKVKLLYGGSVNSKNAIAFIKEGKLNGLLIGGASLRAKEFLKIIKELTLELI